MAEKLDCSITIVLWVAMSCDNKFTRVIVRISNQIEITYIVEIG